MTPTPQEEQETARVAIQLRGEPLYQGPNGSLYGPAMTITDPSEAATYFERLVEYYLAWSDPPVGRVQAEQVTRQNLGYYAGYYDADTMRRVAELFGASHPYLTPDTSAADAFEIGRRLAEGLGVARGHRTP